MKKITISLLLGMATSSLFGGGERVQFGSYNPGTSANLRQELLRVRKEQEKVAALALRRAKEKLELARAAQEWGQNGN